MTGGRVVRVALLACCLLVALVLPSTASAARGLTTGFADPEEYQSAPIDQRQLWFNRTAESGAGIVRLAVEWTSIVGGQRPANAANPADPAYDFGGLDLSVFYARASGLQVLLTINHAPAYAEGPGRPASAPAGSWRPNPSEVAAFAQALAIRYSGSFDRDGAGPDPALPAAQGIQVWNEPNSSDWIAPQFEGSAIVGGNLYRDILNASYGAIKQVNPNMQVVVGGTDPYGDPPGGPYPPNVQRTRPVQFWEQVFCLRDVKAKQKKGKKGKTGSNLKFVRAPGCTGKASFDIFAHHPIDNTGGGPLRHGPSRYDASTPDLGRVVAALRAAERFGTAAGGRHPVWVTEFWWDSKPPNPSGASLITQARWVEQSMYLFWKAGASAAISFQIADSTLRPTVRAGLQAGIYFNDGRPKPSLTAFRFPFVTERLDTRTLRAWGKSPEAGKLKIQRKQGGWKTVKTLKVGKGSVFATKLKLSGKQKLRAVVGGNRSILWKQAAFGAKSGGSSDSGPGAAPIALLLVGGLALLGVGTAALRRRQVQRHRRPRPVTDTG
jgi:MYXO-CTERM domain-containing protein